ncbi:hypothetical protein [Salipaludibacillus sp. CF4.18]|uniref:hypothetical protein n=1 Tax=Salipaludibacillus sp. CF4.18 TaxID=3373081 RepID=UPI003EE7DC8B
MPFARLLMTGIAKILSKVFSMATLTFFGRLPTQDSSKMSFMGLVSLYWIYIIISVFYPTLAEMLIPFLPDDDTIIRNTSIALVLILPLTVGYTSLKLENRDSECSVVKQLLMGYIYSFVLGLLSMVLVIVIPVIKLPSILKMHTQQQFAVMIRKGKYDAVLNDIKDIFEKYEMKIEIHDPKKPIWLCYMSLTYVLEHIFNREIAKEMKYLVVDVQGKNVEVTVHATDISILGPKNETLQVNHILAEEMEPEHLYFSWDDSVQKIEDNLRKLKNQQQEGKEIDLKELQDATLNLRKASLEIQDWNAIRRQIYKIERDHYLLKVKDSETTVYEA